jgi:ABC-type multidrug transport system fused ATPase/permease subunit
MHRYRRLLQYLQRQRSRFILIAVLTVTASSLVALQPWPMKLLVDHVLASNPLPPWLNSATGPAITTQSLLLIVVLGGLCLFILNSLFDAALTWSWTVNARIT